MGRQASRTSGKHQRVGWCFCGCVKPHIVSVRRRNADKIRQDVGRRIAELRALRRWSQEGLAEACEVSAKYVQRIEAGGANLTIASLAKFADALRVDVAELFVRPQTRKPRPGRPRKPRRPKSSS